MTTWSTAELKKLRELRADGLTVPEIAAVMGKRQGAITEVCSAFSIPSAVRSGVHANRNAGMHEGLTVEAAAYGSARLRDAILALLKKREASA